MLKALQPSKEWTKKKEEFWFDPNGEPIRGILAKLIMNSFENGKGNKKRKEAVFKAAGLPI
jgi:hypothetical protein